MNLYLSKKEKNKFRLISLLLVFVVFVSGCVAIPDKADPAGYAQALVDDAIRFYNQRGLQAAIDHYSSPENVDGQWYVFILDKDGYAIAHFNPELIGRDPSLSIDSSGYDYGAALRSTTEAGLWVSYLAFNPGTNNEERKHTWIVRHDRLYFASGWYEKE